MFNYAELVRSAFGIQAYLDPSAMTYVVQIVAGIVLTAAAAFGIYWRKAKKKINTTLNIDEDKNKIVETDEVNIDVDLEEDK
ncbi:MAG: hypothetical protein K5985_11535 [Lachnospiraceae bacterium]|nr:hypothetical protein [Lachnospiraceae bacterium]